MALADNEIGGGRVRRRFNRGGELLAAGTVLTATDVLSIPVANRRSLIDNGLIEVWRKQPPGLEGLKGKIERHAVHLGGGSYMVLEGVRLTQHLITREQALSVVDGGEIPQPVEAIQ